MLRPIDAFEGMNVTICTTYDCNLRCRYDLAKGTKILMSDFSEKNIEDIVLGDKIIGFTEKPIIGEFRRYESAIVEAVGPTRKLTEAYRYKLECGTEIISSGEHPFVNQRNMFQKTEDFYKSDEKNKKVLKDRLPRNIKREFSECIEELAICRFHDKPYDEVPVTIEKINIPETQFYNLTTSSRTFIANGVYVHNCYEVNKHKVDIPIEKVYKFIDKILEDPDPIGANGNPKDSWILKRGLILDFIGGDSFMNPDIIDKTLTYFQYKATMMGHKYATNWRASISSNGTLFGNKDVQKLIKKWESNFNIGISIDGCPAIHDAYRIFRDHDQNGNEVGTMRTITHWWPWLKENAPLAVTTTKATCSKASIPYLYDSLRFMHGVLGITKIAQNFIMEDTGCDEEDYMLLEEEYRKCTEYLIEHRYEIYWSMFDLSGLTKRSDGYADFEESMDTCQCGSGCMPTLSMDGTIYPCFRWLGHTQLDGDAQSAPFCVGDVDNGFNKKEAFGIIREHTRGKISSEYCKECDCEAACAYCIGGCYAENHAFKRTEHICTIAKIRQKWARRYWDAIEELDHNRYDYFRAKGETSGDSISRDLIDIEDIENERRYDDDGNLKTGLEKTPEEIKFEKDLEYWFNKAARDTEVLRIARGQNDIVLNTLKTKSNSVHTEEELKYQIHGDD